LHRVVAHPLAKTDLLRIRHAVVDRRGMAVGQRSARGQQSQQE
jgi:hypothetical protein